MLVSSAIYIVVDDEISLYNYTISIPSANPVPAVHHFTLFEEGQVFWVETIPSTTSSVSFSIEGDFIYLLGDSSFQVRKMITKGMNSFLAR